MWVGQRIAIAFHKLSDTGLDGDMPRPVQQIHAVALVLAMYRISSEQRASLHQIEKIHIAGLRPLVREFTMLRFIKKLILFPGDRFS